MRNINEKEKEFFWRLSEKLEEIFPKGDKSKNRSGALLFNAYANLIFRDIVSRRKLSFWERLKLWMIKFAHGKKNIQ